MKWEVGEVGSSQSWKCQVWKWLPTCTSGLPLPTSLQLQTSQLQTSNVRLQTFSRRSVDPGNHPGLDLAAVRLVFAARRWRRGPVPPTESRSSGSAVLMIANAARVPVIVGVPNTKSAQAKYSGWRTNAYRPRVLRGGVERSGPAPVSPDAPRRARRQGPGHRGRPTPGWSAGCRRLARSTQGTATAPSAHRARPARAATMRTRRERGGWRPTCRSIARARAERCWCITRFAPLRASTLWCSANTEKSRTFSATDGRWTRQGAGCPKRKR